MTLGVARGGGPQDLVDRRGQRNAAGPQELRGRGRVPGGQLEQQGVKRGPKEQAVQGGGLQAEETGLAATEDNQARPRFLGGGGGRVNQQRGEVQQAEGHRGAQAERGPRRRCFFSLLLLLLFRNYRWLRQPGFKAYPVY